MARKVIPINERSALWADPPALFVCQTDDGTKTPAELPPVESAPSPEAAVARARAVRRCMVCDSPLGPRDRTGYCRDHPAQEWRFIECAEPGCNNVKRRTIRGENRYVCPYHRTDPAS